MTKTEVNGDVYGVVNVEAGGKVHQDIHLPKHKSPKQLTATLGISTNFIGRENELKAINEKLTASNSLLLINGIGGVGKSTIASHYLQSKQDELGYYGFFEGLDHFVSDELKQRLNLKSEKTDELFNEAIWKLGELKGVKLLVIDDVKDIEEHEQTIAKILALKEHGYQILFTSREEMDNDKITSFYLDVLNLTDAKNLFKAIYPVPIEDEPLLEAILGYLDCHTLFVELTAKTLKNKKTITLQVLKAKFDSGEFSKVSIKRRESFGKYLSKLFAIDQLDDEETVVLKQLAVLPSIEIPFSILQTVFNPEDIEYFEDILNYLSEKGWLIPSNESYKLHQIIKEFVLADHPPEFETDVLPLVENINNAEFNDIVEIEIMAAIVANCLAEEHEEVVKLANKLVRTYNYIAEYNKATPIAEKIVVIREKSLDKQHPDIAGSYNNLATLYDSQGNFSQALPLHQKALAIREKSLGEQHPDTATSYNNLAALYNSQGYLSQALPLYEKALAIREKSLGKEHPDTAASYNNLAELYRSQGDYSQALPLFQKALAIWEKSLGEQHPDTATSYNNLAALYKSQGGFSQALPLFQKALAICEKSLGEQHPDTATSYNNLAELYRSQEDFNRALPLHKKALTIRKEILGEQHSDTATSYNNLALLYKTKGNVDQALLLYKKALAIRKKSLGEHHLNTALSYNNLASLYKSKGDISQAILLYKKTLEIRKKSLGEQHPDTQTSYYNLIELYESQASFNKALELWKKLLKESSSTTLCEKISHHHIKLKNCQRAKYYAEQANTLAMKPLLKEIKWNIKKAKKLPLKRRRKYCKDS